MTGNPIYYHKNYKYQLSRDWEIDLNQFIPFPRMEYDVLNDFAHLTLDGILKLAFAYAWDGCSGPTVDDATNMRGGLTHDGLCQLMREGLLPQTYLEYANRILQEICKADGMNSFRAWYYYQGVHLFGTKAARTGEQPYPEQCSPCGDTNRPDCPKEGEA